ncbi:type II toxin-antitoxin system Phd/YefM family antitoxin [Alteromonas sp. NFXS44]|uniref:type II toxin-antitoxin system Phd/YefM family antitoxin n=1 Tax=Alteromonas sp. NFXS44 TaxID=2818435 RepID=UPI0032DE5275
MQIKPISFIEEHAADLPVDEPIVVTQNGEPAYVIENYAQRKFRDDAIAMLKISSFSEKDVAAGEVIDSDVLKTRLKQKLKAASESR